jgi:DNA-binding transcriptional ArsR family regulator
MKHPSIWASVDWSDNPASPRNGRASFVSLAGASAEGRLPILLLNDVFNRIHGCFSIEYLCRRILALLGNNEVCVCHIQDSLGLPQPTVSRHLAYLGVLDWWTFAAMAFGCTTSLRARWTLPFRQCWKQFQRAFGQLYVFSTSAV